MKSLTKKYKIKASAHSVWEGLTNERLIEQWSGSRCVMSDREGAEFKLWDGDIWGKNIEVLPHKKLVQEWFSGKWKDPSVVKFEIFEYKSHTDLLLTHTQIPDTEFDGINLGWDDYYLVPLKMLVESI